MKIKYLKNLVAIGSAFVLITSPLVFAQDTGGDAGGDTTVDATAPVDAGGDVNATDNATVDEVATVAEDNAVAEASAAYADALATGSSQVDAIDAALTASADSYAQDALDSGLVSSPEEAQALVGDFFDNNSEIQNVLSATDSFSDVNADNSIDNTNESAVNDTTVDNQNVNEPNTGDVNGEGGDNSAPVEATPAEGPVSYYDSNPYLAAIMNVTAKNKPVRQKKLSVVRRRHQNKVRKQKASLYDMYYNYNPDYSPDYYPSDSGSY